MSLLNFNLPLECAPVFFRDFEPNGDKFEKVCHHFSNGIDISKDPFTHTATLSKISIKHLPLDKTLLISTDCKEHYTVKDLMIILRNVQNNIMPQVFSFSAFF